VIWWPGSGAVEVDVVAGGTWPDWCDRCMTSSAVLIRFYLWLPAGPRFAGVWWACRVCDPQRFGGDEVDGDDGALV